MESPLNPDADDWPADERRLMQRRTDGREGGRRQQDASRAVDAEQRGRIGLAVAGLVVLVLLLVLLGAF